MKPTSLIWYFDRDLRNVDDKKFKDMKIPEKVAILNRAIDEFYDKIFENRDKDPVFNNWLKPFFVGPEKLKVLKESEDYVLFLYPERFQSSTLVSVVAKRGDCQANFEATPIMKQSSFSALHNTMWEPDFDFEQTFRTYDEKGITIYHKKKFEIKEAIIHYIRRPKPIHAASLAIDNNKKYVYHDGETVTYDQDLEFGDGAYTHIVNYAVLLTTDNPSDLNLKLNKMLNIKNY